MQLAPPGSGLQAMPPWAAAGRLRCFDFQRDVFVLDMLGATAYMPNKQAAAFPAAVLSPAQLAAATAMRQMHMPPARPHKSRVPYTPYGGFARESDAVRQNRRAARKAASASSMSDLADVLPAAVRKTG